MSFKNHVDYITSKISRYAGIFYKIRNNLPLKARLNFYYSFTYQFLTYNVINYGSTYSSHLVNLIYQHKKKIRAIANAGYHDHNSQLFSLLKLLQFSNIYRHNVTVYMYQHCSNAKFMGAKAWKICHYISDISPSFQNFRTTSKSIL